MRKKILLFLPILAIICLSFFTFKVKAAVNQIDLIYTNPAEDSSTAMRFAWHAKAKTCVLHYTLATDTSFSYENKKTVVGELNTVQYSSDMGQFYVFKTELNDLDPNTYYIYKITSGSNESDIFKFKTAGFSGSFNFMNFADVHSVSGESGKITNVDKLVGYAEEFASDKGGLDFLLSTGDDVKYGNDYSGWQEYNKCKSKQSYMVAAVNGNHEQKTSKDGNIATKDWFLNTWNNPKNGLDAAPGSYWFIYNNVLFIAIDNQKGSNYPDITKWVESVLIQNEGKYQYSVVYKHFPCFTTGAADYCDYGGYKEWRLIWDRYNVDLVLSGDSHVYVRTHQLYNDKVSTDPLVGTMYMTVPQIPVSTSALQLKTESNPRYAYTGTGAEIGAVYFEVTPEELSLKTYTYNAKVVDSYVIQAKRPFTARADLKEAVNNSLEYVQLMNTNEGIVYANESITSLVKTISFYNDSTLISTFKPSTNKVSTFSLKNLPQNQLLTLKAKITYVDDTTEDVEFTANTYDYFGRISNYKVSIQNNKIKLSWLNELIGNSVNKIKLYRGNEEVGEVQATASSFEFDKIESDSGAIYKLALLSSDGVVIGEYFTTYTGLGDLNYDGKVDALDCDIAAAYVFGQSLTASQKECADINKDNFVDFADITYMWLNYKKDVSLNTNEITVIYKALDGSKLSAQTIVAGNTAIEPVAPIVAGYTFVGWTVSNQSIDHDVTIYPIYSK